jgi:RecA/RadA recombinase
MGNLLDKIMKAGTIKHAEILSESSFFNTKDVIKTNLPILNLAFSGNLDGGIVPGITVFAGISKSFKTLLGLYCMKAYFDKYPDAIALVYDSEFGITPEYLVSNEIDTNRVIHIPVEHVEQLKFDIVKRLEQISRGDKVFILIDSLGAVPSKKELDDAIDEKSVADLSRAKSIRSLIRIITPHITMKDIPLIIVNHVYQSMELYSKPVVGGGTSVIYAANQVFIITKAQEKDGTELTGFNFTINIEKSRFVKEKSKFPFLVSFESGISKWSGLMDIALELNFCTKPVQGWYSRVNVKTGEIEEKRYRLKDTNNSEFWTPILNSQEFKDAVYNKYALSAHKLMEVENDV